MKHNLFYQLLFYLTKHANVFVLFLFLLKCSCFSTTIDVRNVFSAFDSFSSVILNYFQLIMYPIKIVDQVENRVYGWLHRFGLSWKEGTALLSLISRQWLVPVSTKIKIVTVLLQYCYKICYITLS